MVGILTSSRNYFLSPSKRSPFSKAHDGEENENAVALTPKGKNNKLRHDNEALQHANVQMEAQAKHLSQVLQRIREEIKEAENKREAIRYDAARMEERMQRLHRDSSTYRSSTQRCTKEGQSIEMAVISKKTRTNAIPTQTEMLQSSLDQAHEIAKQSQKKFEAARARINELERLELLHRNEVKMLQEMYDTEHVLRLEREEDVEAVKMVSARQKREIDEARMSLADLQSRLQANKTLVAELNAELHKRSQSAILQSDAAAERIECVTEQRCDSYSDLGSFDSSLGLKIKRDLFNSSHEVSSTHMDIRVHAAKMLHYANRAIEKGRSSRSELSSAASSIGSEFRPDTSKAVLVAATSNKDLKPRGQLGKPPLAIRSNASRVDTQQVIVSNIEKVKSASSSCTCQGTLFSGNAEHVEFYLPKLGLACSCGRREKEQSTLDGVDPTVISNILRPWQVEFLSTLNIRNCIDLVHAYNQRGVELATSMRKWRKEKKFPSVKTKSCGIALHIWSQTCKAVIRSVRREKAEGATVFKRPEFLEVATSGDWQTMSTIGCGSINGMNADLLSHR